MYVSADRCWRASSFGGVAAEGARSVLVRSEPLRSAVVEAKARCPRFENKPPFDREIGFEISSSPPNPEIPDFHHPTKMSAREVTLLGGSPWGFRMHGGSDLHQPLRISRVSLHASKDLQKNHHSKPNFQRESWLLFFL